MGKRFSAQGSVALSEPSLANDTDATSGRCLGINTRVVFVVCQPIVLSKYLGSQTSPCSRRGSS